MRAGVLQLELTHLHRRRRHRDRGLFHPERILCEIQSTFGDSTFATQPSRPLEFAFGKIELGFGLVELGACQHHRGGRGFLDGHGLRPGAPVKKARIGRLDLRDHRLPCPHRIADLGIDPKRASGHRSSYMHDRSDCPFRCVCIALANRQWASYITLNG
ncbi:MAG: hypothetical protein HC871_05685 [Rhizobiales bacterium]|nr:hypothetical protein [Hyphomicrobiales bacterium]